MSIVKKKKHVSKKNKKAWRKYCDIQDVEDFLEDQRLEERLGKFEVKPDSELFVVDTAGEESKNVVEEDEKPVLTAKHKRRTQLTETPKCFQVLLPTSKVPDPVVKRNHVKAVGSKPTALSKITHKRKLEKGVYEKKLAMMKKNRKIALEKKRKSKQRTQNFELDLWGQETPESKGIPETLCDEFISPEAQLHNVLPEKRFRAKPAPPTKLVTKPAVELPHPGISYNPSYQEHQDLLQAVVKTEEKLIKKEKHLERVTTRMFRKVSAQDKKNQWKLEMSQGLGEGGSLKPKPSDPDNDEDADNEYKAINPPVKNKKKDHKARRKQRERLAELEELKRKKIEKKKISDIYRLRKLKTVIEKTESKQAKEREVRAKKRALKEAIQPPTLSAAKIPLPEPDFVEPSALTGDLRNIECKANLLRERYESLQRRGALAGAKLMMKKKTKVKSYFKPGHKVTDQDVHKYLAKLEK